MLRAFSVLVLLCGCGDDGGDSTLSGGSGGPGSSSSGGMSTSTSSSTSASSSTSDATTSSSSSSSSGEASTGSTSEPSSSSSAASSDSTTGDLTPLGQCISVDMWESCDQYCEAESDTCQEGGCDGATIHYYDTGGECGDLKNGQPSDQACDAPLLSSAGISFARCCCA